MGLRGEDGIGRLSIGPRFQDRDDRLWHVTTAFCLDAHALRHPPGKRANGRSGLAGLLR